MRFSYRLAAAMIACGAMAATATIADAGHKKGHKGSCPELNRIDPDNDGAMTIWEAKRRALVVFASLNKDKDRTLEMPELKGRISKKQFAAANPDKDGSLDRLEWLRLVTSMFRQANKDGDRTIECDELAKGPGKTLYHLLK